MNFICMYQRFTSHARYIIIIITCALWDRPWWFLYHVFRFFKYSEEGHIQSHDALQCNQICDDPYTTMHQSYKRVTDLVTRVIHSLQFEWLESGPFLRHCIISIGKMNLSHFKWARVISSFENSDSMSHDALQLCNALHLWCVQGRNEYYRLLLYCGHCKITKR